LRAGGAARAADAILQLLSERKRAASS
jgi:hypothetical protein